MQIRFPILTLSDPRVQILITLLEMNGEERERYGAYPVTKRGLSSSTKEDFAVNPDRFIRMPNGGYARKCNAQKRRGRGLCGAMAVRDREKCRIHGGQSTGPKTSDGKRRATAHLVKHGRESRAQREIDRAHGRWWQDVGRLLNKLGVTDNSAGLPGNPGRPKRR